jgi:hypothetical protein
MRRHTTAATGLLFTAVLCFAFPGTASAADDQNCSDFTTQQDAQAHFDQDKSDPDNLDIDNDKQACEALPNGLSEDNTALAGSTTSATATTTTSAAATTTTATPTTAATTTTSTPAATTTTTAAPTTTTAAPTTTTAAATTTTAAPTTTAAAATTTVTPATAAAATTTPSQQIAVLPSGAVAAGDGSTADDANSAIPYTVGGLALIAAGGAAYAARRNSRRAA